MSKKEEMVIDLLRRFSPKDFGVKSVYYRTDGDSMSVLFIVNKSSAPSMISYLSALSSIIEKEVGGVTIQSNIYIHESGRDKVQNVTQREKLTAMDLININVAGAHV